MLQQKNLWLGLGLVLGILLISSISFAKEQVLFTKYNIHVQNQLDRRGNHVFKASYANYTNPGSGHVIIPAGSEITIMKKGAKEIVFVYNKEGMKVEFEYHEPRMGMRVNDYIALITSEKPVPLQGLSALDRKGIQEGKAYVGMTRLGIMTALGYPATHKTPSLEGKTWVYWTNRFGTLAVEFDDQGKVVKVTE